MPIQAFRPERFRTYGMLMILILSPYDNGAANIGVANTVISNASLRTGTLNGSGPMQVYSSQITNPKQNDTGAVCGTYNGTVFMNFVSLSDNGVVYPACSYTFNAKEEWKNDAYNLLFNDDKERIHLHGTKVDAATYASSFTLTVNSVAETGETPYNLTLTYWEPAFANSSARDWTILNGARIKLFKNIHIGALDIPDATDVKINLNGFKLTVSSLTIGSEKMTGEFTAANLSALAGDGSLLVGGHPLIIFVR